MSSAIRNSLSNLNLAIDRLDKALLENQKLHKEQQQELYAARSALNDNGFAQDSIPGINSANAEQFALRLDNAIDKVERLLREG